MPDSHWVALFCPKCWPPTIGIFSTGTAATAWLAAIIRADWWPEAPADDQECVAQFGVNNPDGIEAGVVQATYEESAPFKEFRCADISTCHLSAQDREILTQGGPGIYDVQHGWLVSTGVSASFGGITEAARKAGLQFIWFDEAGIDYDHLERHDL